jgi:hypothetical protein
MAQGNSGRTSFGVLGGVNFQNLNGENNNGNKLENDLIIGYHAGVNIQIPIAPEFYFQPGLMFSTKGAENTAVLSPSYKLSYVEVPLNFVYKGQVGNGFVFVGFGPYVAYGISGKSIYEVGSVTSESDITFKKDLSGLGENLLANNYIKPLDAGGNILFGYELAGGLFLQFNAQLGLLNIRPDNYDENSTLKNTGYGISLGYRF